MTQNNLYMEDDEMRLYVDVQPLLLDEIENSRNAAVASAALAAQSEENARNWKNSIIDYKTAMELFYAQASDGLTNLYNNSKSELTLSKNNVLNNIEMAKRTAINNINTNGQNYITQVQTIVDNRVSTEHLNQSKCLMTGEETTDSDAVNQVKGYAHSTFDRTKFTVVGSPVITSDGIASGFSSGNYLTTPNTINFSTAKTWSFKIKFNTGFSWTDEGLLSGDTVLNVQAIINNSGVLRGSFGDGTAWIWNLNPIAQLELNTDYILEMGYNGTAYYIKLNGVLKGSYPSDTKVSNTPIRLGVERTNGYFFTNGSIDLKQFLISVDGIPVFSGNKTGIDTIKPDNWTNKVRLFAYSDDTHTIYANSGTTPAVLYNSDGSYYIGSDFTVSGGKVYYGANECAYTSGSDIILTLTNTTVDAGCKVSNDGILTQFRSANYNLYKDLNISAFSNFEYDFSFVSGSVSGFFQHPDLATFISIWVNQAGGITFALQKSGNVAVNNSSQTIDGLGNLTGKKVYVKIIFKNGFSEYRVKVENGEWKSVSFTSTDTSFTPYFSSLKFTSYTANTVTAYDLNDARFYNNGDLVYQPCLKIPYTLSKTGSKIVNAVYRDRVKCVYDMGFVQGYYALDEENNKAWLPIGDIYGMIENLRKLIIERTSE